MSGKDDVIKAAIEAIQEERRQLMKEVIAIQEDLRGKQERLRSLGAFIEHGKLLIGDESEPVVPGRRVAIIHESTPSKDETTADKPTVADRIVMIFHEVGGPLKPRRIAQEFYNRGWPLSPKNGAEVVRYAMKRKRESFVIHKDGTFSLKEKQ
jgi:hypothetical protein